MPRLGGRVLTDDELAALRAEIERENWRVIYETNLHGGATTVFAHGGQCRRQHAML
jgi:hypothetical protein